MPDTDTAAHVMGRKAGRAPRRPKQYMDPSRGTEILILFLFSSSKLITR